MSILEEPSGAYDLVVGDAFSSRSVPWHLTTEEFLAEVRRVLRPDGVYAMNLIDGGTWTFCKPSWRRSRRYTTTSSWSSTAVRASGTSSSPPRRQGLPLEALRRRAAAAGNDVIDAATMADGVPSSPTTSRRSTSSSARRHATADSPPPKPISEALEDRSSMLAGIKRPALLHLQEPKSPCREDVRAVHRHQVDESDTPWVTVDRINDASHHRRKRLALEGMGEEAIVRSSGTRNPPRRRPRSTFRHRCRCLRAARPLERSRPAPARFDADDPAEGPFSAMDDSTLPASEVDEGVPIGPRRSGALGAAHARAMPRSAPDRDARARAHGHRSRCRALVPTRGSGIALSRAQPADAASRARTQAAVAPSSRAPSLVRTASVSASRPNGARASPAEPRGRRAEHPFRTSYPSRRYQLHYGCAIEYSRGEGVLTRTSGRLRTTAEVHWWA